MIKTGVDFTNFSFSTSISRNFFCFSVCCKIQHGTCSRKLGLDWSRCREENRVRRGFSTPGPTRIWNNSQRRLFIMRVSIRNAGRQIARATADDFFHFHFAGSSINSIPDQSRKSTLWMHLSSREKTLKCSSKAVKNTAYKLRTCSRFVPIISH